MCAEPPKFQRPNINRLAAQRSELSADKSNVTPEEVNQLLQRNGKKPRSNYRMSKALHFSALVVSARLVSNNKLVAMTRAISDGALNSTILDVLVDPELVDRNAMKRAIMTRTLQELNKLVPDCSVALLAPEEDVLFYTDNHSFRVDDKGVKLMALVEENWELLL